MNSSKPFFEISYSLFLMTTLVVGSVIPGNSRSLQQRDHQIKTGMSKALTFYVSFDNGSAADLGKGDKNIYTGDFKGGPDQTGIVSKPGLGKPPLLLAKGKGKHGTALEFTAFNSHVVFYNLEKNIEYDENNFAGTASFWINTDANEIPGQYCDPIQITDKYYASDAIWVDITKNDIPPDLRLGVYGDQKGWDVKN